MKKLPVVVVSGFDGLSGGRIAFDRVEHIDVLRYYSSEVDKYAIRVADHNYPQDTPYRLGDITKVDGHKLLKEIREEFGDVKIILIGGSPCQGFSMAGKLQGSSTACGIDVVSLEQYMDLKAQNFEFNGQSYLFWEFVRLQKEIQPDYFMLENVKISNKWLPMFNEVMKISPIIIDSCLVSFQNRKRYYWTNIPDVLQPEDKNIYLKDNYCKEYNKSLILTGRGLNKLSRPRNRAKQILDDKCPTILREQCSKATDSLVFYMPDGTPRYPTRREMELMQNLPIGHTDCVGYNDAAAMIGNGWTIDIPAHIFRHIPLELDTNQE